jgi:arsenite oxidase small subunit
MIDFKKLSRRDFIKASGTGVAGVVAAKAIAPSSAAAQANTGESSYPVVDVADLSDIEPETPIDFTYPDENSPAVLVRLPESALGGVGPDNSIVAYSILCTHKGCPVNYTAERKMFICPCHWSTFDPAKAGTLVIGQASEPLPQIELRIVDGKVQAVGVNGLIYGRHTNIA